MPYKVRLGSLVDQFREELEEKVERGKASKRQKQLLGKFARVVSYLEDNPFYHRLETHDIPPLTKRFGETVYVSYMENKRPKAYRVVWAFGPNEGEITILNVVPHPQNNREYARIPLSDFPED